jgi:hypothetical protein
VAKAPAVPKPLRDATKGLTFPSETDAPVEPFAWPAGPVTAAGVLAAAGIPGKPNVEELTVSDFFRAVPTAARGEFFDLLLALGQHLSGVKVFKVGGPKFAVYVVGTTADGHRAGVRTEVVET